MSFNASCTEISFSAKTGCLEAVCSNGEKSSIDLNAIIGLTKDKTLIWNSSGFLPVVKNAHIYNYGNMVDLEVDAGKWAPKITTLNLSRFIADRNGQLVFLHKEFLEAEQHRLEEDQLERGKGGVWKGLFGRPEKGPDFLGQSRITGRLR